MVKADLRTKPVPQVLLLTCNLVATKGLSTPNLFQAPHPPPDQVATLTQRLGAPLTGRCKLGEYGWSARVPLRGRWVALPAEDRLLLLPSDLDPALAAAVIVHFLETLEEPLLTFK